MCLENGIGDECENDFDLGEILLTYYFNRKKNLLYLCVFHS